MQQSTSSTISPRILSPRILRNASNLRQGSDDLLARPPRPDGRQDAVDGGLVPGADRLQQGYEDILTVLEFFDIAFFDHFAFAVSLLFCTLHNGGVVTYSIVLAGSNVRQKRIDQLKKEKKKAKPRL